MLLVTMRGTTTTLLNVKSKHSSPILIREKMESKKLLFTYEMLWVVVDGGQRERERKDVQNSGMGSNQPPKSSEYPSILHIKILFVCVLLLIWVIDGARIVLMYPF